MMRFFGISFVFQGRGVGEIKTFCISLFSKWDGSCHHLQLPQAPHMVLAGGLSRSPLHRSRQPHTFSSPSSSLSELKIKQIPDGATYSTGERGTSLMFLREKPSSSLTLEPPLTASINWHPALGAHISPQTSRKANPHCWHFSKLQHRSTEPSPPSSGTREEGLGSPSTNTLSTALLVWGQHLLGTAWRRPSTHLLIPAQFKPSF